MVTYMNKKMLLENELSFLNKVRERLRDYACGSHKQLDDMILNRLKRIERLLNCKY